MVCPITQGQHNKQIHCFNDGVKIAPMTVFVMTAKLRLLLEKFFMKLYCGLQKLSKENIPGQFLRTVT